MNKKASIANAFCKQYANIKEYKPTTESRRILRQMKKTPIDRSYTPFTATLTAEAVKAAKSSTAIGPNSLNVLHLKHLGRNGISFLTRLFNLSVREADIPAIWRSASVVPVPKPGKPLDKGPSYRPISLLCPEVKVLERLIYPDLVTHLKPNESQHGFRPRHSTVTALLPLVTQVAEGFNQPKPASRTGLLSVDLSRAFDIVDRVKLLQKIDATNLNPNLKRWMVAYLRDRRISVRFQGSTSRWRKVRLGVPQGSVVSPILFNFFTSDLNLAASTINESYADDVHSAESSPELEHIEAKLNASALEMETWASTNGMEISAPKSSVTLFTPWTKQVNCQLEVDVCDARIPTEKHPKLLGVTFDPLFSFSTHASIVARKATSRLNLLRALSDTKFGHDKEVLLGTFKQYLRSVTDYAAPIVFPNYSTTSLEKLQKIQNRALRLALGCHNAASIDHLHAEAQELPVSQHLRLLSAQFLARTLQPSHPSYGVVTRPPGRRLIKHTLRSKVIDDVQPFLDANGDLPPGTYQAAINSIHTNIVAETVRNQSHNRVLDAPPPPISKQEKRLPRITRAILSQLRSGMCSRLKDYQLMIGRVTDSVCPECYMGQQNVRHLFECPRFPTPLIPHDLWSFPCDVASYLSSVPTFSSVVQPPPPPPPPRRGYRGRPPAAPDPQGTLHLSSSSLFSSLSLPSGFLSSSSFSSSSSSSSLSP